MSLLVTLGHYLLTIFGIGFVIFVHELGHYLAARAVGVRVEAFSIGFGPRLFGFRRGPTDYKICLVPLGGFVKMAGENPDEPRRGDSDEFGSKSVPARILVISAGVIMNVVFAVVALPLAFCIGVPFEAPVVGAVVPGGPAWRAGVEPGDRIASVDGHETLSFTDAATSIAVGGGGPVRLSLVRDGRPLEIEVQPGDVALRGVPTIGIEPAEEPIFLDSAAVDPSASEDSPSGHRARAGLAAGDEIVAIDGYATNEWTRGELGIGLAALEARTLTVRRRGETATRVVELAPLSRTDEAAPARFGMVASRLHVAEVKPDSPAARAGLKQDDLVLAVDGAPVYDRASLVRALLRGTGELAVAGPDGSARTLRFDEPSLRRSLHADLAYGTSKTHWLPQAGGPAAAAGWTAADELIALDGAPVAGVGALNELQGGKDVVSVTLRRPSPNGPKETTIELRRGRVPSNAAFVGLPTRPLRETVQASGLDAFSKGLSYTSTMTRRIAYTIRSIFARRVSAENLGGIITIFRQSVASTEVAPSRGLLFLAVISINLAVLNILPIPVLDGGWLVLLLIEAVRKKPVPTKVLVVVQWIGLLLVLGLMLYVTWNDLVRLGLKSWFGG